MNTKQMDTRVGSCPLHHEPIGKPLYETGGWVGHPRISPKGDLIAFADHPVQGDDSGSLATIDQSGHKKVLTREWFTIQGLAWSPNGKEIWFTASESGTDRTLYAISLDGKQRIVARLRCSELLGLKWSDFDWDGLTILVQRAVVAGRVDSVKPSIPRRGCLSIPLWPRSFSVGR